MSRITSVITAVVASFIITPQICHSQINHPEASVSSVNSINNVNTSDDAPLYDPEVLSLLKKANLSYVIDKNWDFAVTYGTDDTNRCITIHIDSNTSRFANNLEIRRLWSIAYTSTTPLSAEAATNLLKRNALLKIGSWSIIEQDDVNVIIFTVNTNAQHLTAGELRDTLKFIAVTVDGMYGEMSRNGKPIWPVPPL